MKTVTKLVGMFILSLILLSPGLSSAAEKKGLLVYSSVYGSTAEVAYWIKAIIGHEQHLDVKALPQVITVKPYDYVIIGSLTRDEKPKDNVYEFLEKHKTELAKKEVCYFLTCGDSDETMVLKIPGKDAHLIGGRNYLFDTMATYPEIKPVVIAGFGGRQVLTTMGTKDSFTVWLVGKLAKEGASWEGHDIWETLEVRRVEAFGNDVRVKVLGLEPRENIEQLRGYWTSLQPGNLADPKLKKFKPKPYSERRDTDKIYFVRGRLKGNLNGAVDLLKKWARESGIDLRKQKSSFFNAYYHAVKNYDGNELTAHVVIATFPEDPGNVQYSFRSWEKPAKRKGLQADITKAEKILGADGRKVD